MREPGEGSHQGDKYISKTVSFFGTAFSGVLCCLIFCPESEYFNRSGTPEEYGENEKLLDGLADLHKEENQLK